jgi:hypothetical protein
MASVVKDIPVSQDNNNNDNNNTDEDNKDLTKLGQRAQTDYTKFDRVEDVPENETALEIALKLKAEGNNKFKTTDFKGAISHYSEALNTLGNESVSATKDLTEQQKQDRSNCKLAVLSNRAACYNNIREYKKAKEDCDTILKDDEEHIKGLYRRGEAFLNLNDEVKAYKDFYNCLLIDKKNKQALKKVKLLRKSLHKRSIQSVHDGIEAKKRKKEEDARKEERKKAKKRAEEERKRNNPTSSNDDDNYSYRKTKSSSKDDDVELIEGESDVVRGYKKTKDGRTTSYFTRELDEKAKSLIGDITPKRIVSKTTNNNTPKRIDGSEAVRNDKQSAWNTAGTWEDKDKTKWAKKRLKTLMEDIVIIEENGNNCQVTKVEKLEGDASIISARGKVRYVYDFGFELKFTFIFAATGNDSNNKDKGDDSNDDEDDDKNKKRDNKIKGTLVYRDMCNDADLDDEGVRGILQSLRKPPKDANVKRAYYEMVEKLREKVQQTMQVFTMDFKSQ